MKLPRARRAARSGATHTQWVDAPKGDPGNPFTDTECREKFDDLASAVYSPDTAMPEPPNKVKGESNRSSSCGCVRNAASSPSS